MRGAPVPRGTIEEIPTMSQYGSPPDPDQPDSTPPTPPTPPGGSGAPQDPYAAPPPAPNPYGSAPQDPYAAPPPAPNPYGAAPANPYGNAPAYGGAQTAQLPAGGYASWIKRVGAYFLDGLLGFVAALPLIVGYVMLFNNATTTTDPDGTKHLHLHASSAAVPLILIGVLTSIAFWIWNICIRQGRTGYTIGKGVLGIKLIDENTSQPVGGGMAFLRQIVHILDGFCYIGYLWPLWDAKNQTFADKIMHTVVVNQPQGS